MVTKGNKGDHISLTDHPDITKDPIQLNILRNKPAVLS